MDSSNLYDPKKYVLPHRNKRASSASLNFCYLLLLLTFLPSTSFSASLMYPGYLLKYKCGNIDKVILKPEHELKWRMNTAQGNPKMVPNRYGGTIIMWEEGEIGRAHV